MSLYALLVVALIVSCHASPGEEKKTEIEKEAKQEKRSLCGPWNPWCRGAVHGGPIYGGAFHGHGCGPWDPYCKGHVEEISHVKKIGIKTIPVKGYTTHRVINHVPKPVVDYIHKKVIDYVPVKQTRIVKKPVPRLIRQKIVRYVHHPVVSHIKKPYVTYHKKPVYSRQYSTHHKVY